MWQHTVDRGTLSLSLSLSRVLIGVVFGDGHVCVFVVCSLVLLFCLRCHNTTAIRLFSTLQSSHCRPGLHKRHITSHDYTALHCTSPSWTDSTRFMSVSQPPPSPLLSPPPLSSPLSALAGLMMTVWLDSVSRPLPLRPSLYQEDSET